MDKYKSSAMSKLIAMRKDILSKATPTGVTMEYDLVPVFEYNKTITKLLQDIEDLRWCIMQRKETTNGS